MQIWVTAWGNTALIAWVNPLRLSVQAISISSTPRAFRSVKTLIQNAADSVLIPVQCEYYALEGLTQLLTTIKMVKNSFNPPLVIEGYLLTMFDSRLKLANQVEAELRKFFGDKVFKTKIARNVKLGEAPSYGKPISVYDPFSVGAKNYEELGSEFIERNK